MEKILVVSKRFIWLPIANEAKENTKIAIFVDGEKIQELFIGIKAEKIDYYAAFDAEKYLKKEMVMRGDFEEAWIQKILLKDTKPDYRMEIRPYLHYTPSFGWMNDPNGLVYDSGVFHVYHQHNPYGVS